MTAPIEELGQMVQASVTCPDCDCQHTVGLVIEPDGDDYRAAILNPVAGETMESLLADWVARRAVSP